MGTARRGVGTAPPWWGRGTPRGGHGTAVVGRGMPWWGAARRGVGAARRGVGTAPPWWGRGTPWGGHGTPWVGTAPPCPYGACISVTGRYNRVTYSLTMRRVLNTGAIVAIDSLLIASQRCGMPSGPRS